ncbi:expressed unknown protein [Seminavis robusta]|uniref:Uncharacterized protein n=1 Tax=Seminavis robusta TaxID=568900 RepID=A0A9N8EBE3_9STRA|nr:expressed unknown protein [Seminavis robusta]|eukprot:Sro877_g214670.1 n/a (583) ;mRNA; f:25071-26819
MADNTVQCNDDDSEASAEDISVWLAKTLMRCSHNSRDVSVSQRVDLNQCCSKEVLEFVNEALKYNSLIENLEIELCDEFLPIALVEDICYFISNNPSLRILRISGGSFDAGTNSQEISQCFLEAAHLNESIVKIQIGEKAALPADLECVASCKELELDGFMERLAESWPSNFSVETLRLYRQEQPMGEFEEYLSTVLERLEDSPSSMMIRHLDLGGWSYLLPTFLSSSKSAVERLELLDVQFQHDSDTGCSIMDGLLWGLMGSITTTKLDLIDCGFDALSIKKLLTALKSNRLPVEHLRLKGLGAFQGKDLFELLALPCLKSLGLIYWHEIEEIDQKVNDGLQVCSLDSVAISTDRLARLQLGLERALRFQYLASVELYHCTLLEEADINCLVRLIEDKRCKLRSLALSHVTCGGDAEEGYLESKVFECLQRSVRLESLYWEYDDDEIPHALFNAAKARLENWTLTTLKVLTPNATAPGFYDAIDNIAEAMPGNWSLEEVTIAGACYDCEDQIPLPICTAGQLDLIAAVTERNRLRQIIFSPSLLCMTKADCVMMLASLWDLPDWQTLALWLLEEVPHHFFE